MTPPSRNVRLLTAIHFCAGLRFSGPFLIIYFARVSGSFTLGMSMFAVTSLAQTLLDVPTGVLSDSVGRKATIVGGMCADLIATVCYAAAPGYGLLAAGAALQGSAWALYSGNNDALLYESLAAEGSADAYPAFLGRLLAAQHLAFGIAAIVGGVFALESLRLVFGATLVPQLLALACCLALREPPRRAKPVTPRGHLAASLRQFRASPALRLLTVAAALRYAVGEAGYQFQQAFVATLWPAWALGVAPTLSNLGGAASFYVSGRVVRRLGAVRVLIGDALCSRVLSVAALAVPTVVSPALLASTSLTYGPGEVAMNALLQEQFTDAQRATLSSLASFVGTFAYAVAAVSVGVVADRLGPMKTLLVVQAVLLLPLLLYRRLLRKPNPAFP
ncbi:MAG: MFS transporter [Dehalococcoidia bacterium]